MTQDAMLRRSSPAGAAPPTSSIAAPRAIAGRICSRICCSFLAHGRAPDGSTGGFWRAESALWPRVQDWLSKCGPGEVVVTGHSLGAAMATVTAARLPESRLVTFGSPRVGTRAFAAAFSADRV